MKGKDTSKEALASRLDPQAVLREALMAESQGGGADALNEELRRQAAERAFGGGADEPTDDALWAAYERAWKGDDS